MRKLNKTEIGSIVGLLESKHPITYQEFLHKHNNYQTIISIMTTTNNKYFKSKGLYHNPQRAKAVLKEALILQKVRGFKKLNKNAFIPQRINSHAAGYDLQALYTVELKPYKITLVKTGITSYMPKDEVGIVANRSSNPVKRGLLLMNGIGVIDSDYTGDISVELMNINNNNYTIHRGQKIAQFMFMPYRLSDNDNPVTNSKRGKNGFGYHFWNGTKNADKLNKEAR